MYSPLKEVYVFNKNITTLRVKMVKKESGGLKRVRKTIKIRNYNKQKNQKTMKYQENQESGSKQEPKEDCQISRIQKPKSLEDWHNTRVRI
jgi:hypothetical protein